MYLTRIDTRPLGAVVHPAITVAANSQTSAIKVRTSGRTSHPSIDGILVDMATDSREMLDDESDDDEVSVEKDSAPAPAAKNYITPGGLQRLRDELRFLLTRERPAVTQVVAWAAGNGDRSENADYQYGKRRLRQIDRRIHFLRKRIDAAEVVDPEAPRSGRALNQVF